MARFTVSLDDDVAGQFDELNARRGQRGRSDALRDLIRNSMALSNPGGLDDRNPKSICVAILSYVIDQRDLALVNRSNEIKIFYGALVMSTQCTPLGRHRWLETMILRGHVANIRAFVDAMTFLGSLRHIHVQVVLHERLPV